MEYLKRFLEYAPEAYDAIRDTDDVAGIARNTGWAEFRIRRIKKHLFYDQHQLDYDLAFNRFRDFQRIKYTVIKMIII